MDLEELQKQFVLGSTVIVADVSSNARFGSISTFGMRGCVSKLDARAGVCVSIFISRIFQPCFWYRPSSLAIDTELKPFMPVPAARLVILLGGRVAALTGASITTGMLRSWLIDRSQARPGQVLYSFIAKMNFKDLVYVYQDPDDGRLAAWLKDNDSRVRRPMMTDSTAAEEEGGTNKLEPALRIKRTKIG